MTEFSKEFLLDILCSGDKVIEDKIVEHRRWSVDHEMIFKHEGKYYRSYYSRGATEMQDEQPYEHEKDPIKVTEVKKVQIVTFKWVPVDDPVVSTVPNRFA